MQRNESGDLIGKAIEAAEAACREILAVYGTSFTVEQKEDRSPLTEADLRAHRAISAVLKATGLPILSEEGKAIPLPERQAWERYWLVDPLDGTKEFVKRNGEFTVNIALMGRDELPLGPLGSHRPLGGVIAVPVKDRVYFAWEGGGAHRQDKAATFAGKDAYDRASSAMRIPVPHQREAFTVVASRSHQSVETQAFIERMRKEHGAVETTSMGSALKICLVAEGAADVYPRYAPTMEWDTAAGHAIALEAGKDLVDVTTERSMRYNRQDLVNQWFIVQ
ncbi:MAG: 3'(2'),5'-bisphosphate nucleotidase CysQ [Flavobacteriales bacterium]|nr:3'(2'),5'-bisphosphate nucleotidase CysQ [Flavobacteriales bacterium]